MTFVPVAGPATFRPGEPPREAVVEFTDQARTVLLPIRAAIPVLSRAHRREEAHRSVALLSGAVLLGLRLVAAGKLAPATDGTGWVAVLDAADRDRVQMLARARCDDGLDAEAAHTVICQVLDAVVDAMPRGAPVSTAAGAAAGGRAGSGAGPDFQTRLRRLAARSTASAGGAGAEPAQLVDLVLRLEADEEELLAGSVRLVLGVVDAHDDLHTCDAAVLWTGETEEHGFGDRARTHATLALRAAAEAWPVLERLLELRVPDQLVLDTDEIVSLLDEGVAALEARGISVLFPRSLTRGLTADIALDRHRPSRVGEEPLVSGLFGTEDVFAFRWQLALHGDRLTEEEMDQLAASTSGLVKIRDNWTVVDSATLRRAKRRMIRTLTPAQAVAATLTGVEVAEDQEHAVIVGASLEQVRDRVRQAATREPVPTPAGLAGDLRDYQRHALTWLADLTSLGLGACLADDMGLGKTITLIALHLHRASTRPPGALRRPTLVVCPASLLGNWEAEIRRFAPGVAVRRFHGTARDLDGLAGGFVLTTYGTMRTSVRSPDQAGSSGQAGASGPSRQLLTDVDWDLVVADEAQHIKNPQSGTARALRRIPGSARVALTGTPVENNLTELWAILDWAIPGLLGSRNAFRKVWAAPIEAGVDPAIGRRFADLIGPFLLRRRKSDPGIAPELPAKTETDHLIGLTREQVVLYETLVRDSMRRISEADPDSRRGLVLKLLTGLKQICNHPAHYLKQANPRLTGRSEKLALLDELLGTVLAEGGAALVFTQYVAMARLLERHLSAAGIPHQFLHGSTPVAQRETMVRRFQAADDADPVPVFLLSLKAGGTGLNLTRADHVIHFDRWWNPATEDQATDRAYRIGQQRPVQVHRLVTEGTIEQRIAEMLARKRSLADSVLARGETALTELDDAELEDLVTLRRAPVSGLDR